MHIISGKINFYSTHLKKSAFYDFNENMIKQIYVKVLKDGLLFYLTIRKLTPYVLEFQ